MEENYVDKIVAMTERAVRAEVERDVALSALQKSEEALNSAKAKLEETEATLKERESSLSWCYDERSKNEKRIKELEEELAKLKGATE